MARHQLNRRTAKGQGLIEASCGTVIIVTTFVFLLMLGLNVYSVITTDSKLRLVCSEAAQVREEYTYFLGMRRQDFTDAQADAIARQTAVNLAAGNGVNITADDVSFSVDTSAAVATTTCAISLNNFALPYGGGVFPSILRREVSATVARMSAPAPAIAALHGDSPEYGQLTVRVPCYGGTIPIAGAHDPIRDLQHGRARGIPGAPTGPIGFGHAFGVGVNANGLIISGPKNSDGNPLSNPNRQEKGFFGNQNKGRGFNHH